MSRFTDAKGKDWVIEIDTLALKRILSMTGFRFDDLIPKNMGVLNGHPPNKAEQEKNAEKYLTAYLDFVNDDIRFGDVLFAILHPQAVAAKITQEDFDNGRLLGEANQRAIAAFHQAFADFSHARNEVRATFLRAIKIGLKKVDKELETVNALTDEQVQTQMESAMELAKIQLAKQEMLDETPPATEAIPSSKPATDTAALSA